MLDEKELLFEEWKASLSKKDRTVKSVEENFQCLFDNLKNANVTFEDAFALIDAASKAHYPKRTVAINTYNTLKSIPRIRALGEKLFIEEWHKDIDSKCKSAFFSVYPKTKQNPVKPKDNNDDDGEPKVFGNMSAKEYRLQRQYADQFPILNTEELEKRLRDTSYNPLEDYKRVLSEEEDGSFK